MAWGVNSVLSMGVGALFASQANIQVTGNNISNVNTPGYSRQAVIQTERYALDFIPGQVGQGVNTKEVIRYYDKFIEKSYLSKLGTSTRFTTAFNQMRTIEELFNEANVDGNAAATMDFFAAWNELVKYPNESAAREALLAKAGIVIDGLNMTDRALLDIEEQLNTMIRQDIDTANQLMREIADLNNEIATSYLAGRNNPNQLLDARDAKVRELGAIIDVSVQDDGPGHYRLTMANGTVLVQDTIPFSLSFQGPRVENNLSVLSDFKGLNAKGTQRTAYFDGSDSKEYTIEIVNAGATGSSGTPGAATFRVSVDGGKTWLKDDNGNILEFNANEDGNAVRVGELDIWFDAGNLSTGDRFVLSPKSDIYWHSPTSGPMNISTQMYPDGSSNTTRITGGSLGGYLEIRDYRIGEYRDRLDAFTKSLVWEVNRIHSQGAGLEPFSHAHGSYSVGDINVPMGTPDARFTWADKLQSGNMTFKVYDKAGNQITGPEGLNVFSMLPGGNFDPSRDSLQDVVNAINAPGGPEAPSNYMSASIVDGKLVITAKNDADGNPYGFAMSADTSGLAAALGINTFFTGDSANSIAVRDELFTNTNLINAGRLDGNGEINEGDNQTARELTALAAKAVDVSTTWNKTTRQTLSEYYGTIVTKVGADTRSVKFTAGTETAMAADLYNRQEEISGVNLDEEMSNLIKFQASYKAAAKLITTADEMLQTLLSLKQ